MIKKFLWSTPKRKYITIGIGAFLCICLLTVALIVKFNKDEKPSIGNQLSTEENNNKDDEKDDELVTDESVTDETVTDESVTNEPTTDEAVTGDSTVGGSTTNKPATNGTTTNKPASGNSSSTGNGSTSNGNTGTTNKGTVSALNSLSGRNNANISHGYICWNFNKNAENFSLTSGSKGVLQHKNDALGWDVASGDQLLTPSGLKIPTKSVSTIEIRMLSTKATSITVYWKTKGGSFSESAKATIKIKADGKLHDYQIELGQHSKWPEDAQIDQLKFVTTAGGDICFDFFRLSGIYVVPFPGLSGNYDADVKHLKTLKATYSDLAPGIIVGFSARIEYLADTDSNGNYVHYKGQATSYMNIVDPYYYLRLAKATDMPVMLWLRGDPWGDLVGTYRDLRVDKNNYMWTAATTNPAYVNNETGYAYLSLAKKDLNGNTTAYWKATEKLLGQCAKVVADLIEDNPNYFLGVTTTSELKFNATDQSIDLDYNPNTIKEFADYCKNKYGTVAKLNAACGTNFTTFALKSTDYNPATVENQNGFDAPRVRNNSAFWKLWTTFRVEQVTNAVERQVDIVEKYIDAKHIWTHQIAIGQDPFVSPEEAGNIEGSNVGIDMFNHEVTTELVKKIASFVKNDYSRAWGVPEWLVMRDTHQNTAYSALEIMDYYGVKYICPFWWGANGNEFDIKGTGAEKGIVQYLRGLK